MKVLVCQHGARHRYAVPIILHRLGMLEALYTDTTAYSTLGRLARTIKKFGINNSKINKVASRTINEIPVSKIYTKDIWSEIFPFPGFRNVDSLAQVYLNWGTKNADCIYSMNAVDIQFLEYAHQKGLKIVIDAFTNPLTDKILSEECEKFGFDNKIYLQQFEWWKKRYDIAASIATIILCPSEWVADAWINLYPDIVDKIRICPYGSSLPKVHKINPSPDKVIMFAGRAPMIKGLYYLAQAAKFVHVKYPDWKIVVAGLTEKQVPWIDNGHLIYLGNLPLDEIHSWYKRSYAFILPSLTEGQASVILEAMSSGCPVIATRESGVTIPSNVGITIPSRNVDAIIDTITSLIQNFDQRQSFAQMSLQYVDNFSLESWSNRLNSIFSTLKND